jgi:hypothetical protein
MITHLFNFMQYSSWQKPQQTSITAVPPQHKPTTTVIAAAAAAAAVVLLQERLVAMGGKLVTLKEQAGEAPNGTSFMITTGPAPQLDSTNLIVGKVGCTSLTATQRLMNHQRVTLAHLLSSK